LLAVVHHLLPSAAADWQARRRATRYACHARPRRPRRGAVEAARRRRERRRDPWPCGGEGREETAAVAAGGALWRQEGGSSGSHG
jgi:hypothetical protein